MTTKKPRKHVLLTAAFVACLASLSAWGADGDARTFEGLITRISGDTVTIKDSNNVEHAITLTPATTYKKRVGLAAVRFERAERSALITGLPIVADTVAQGDGYTATAISFKSEQMRTAQQVQAGMEETAARTAANAERIENFSTYEALATTEVLFDSGSAAISAKGKADLMAIADKSKQTKDYRVVVQGFTDATGDAAANQRLSDRRAKAVTTFLQQQAGLSPGRVMEGDGMGVAADAGSGSNAGARKVVVKLVVDKGVQGGD